MLCSLPSKTAFGFDPSTHDPPRGQEDAANANATTSEPEVLTDSPSSWQFLPHQIFTESEIHQPTQPPNQPNFGKIGLVGWKIDSVQIHPSLTKIPISWKVSHHFWRNTRWKITCFLVTGCLPVCPAGLIPLVQTGYPLWDVVAAEKMFQVTKVNTKNCWNHHRKRESWKSMLGESSFIIQWTCLMLKDALIPSSNNLSFQPIQQPSGGIEICIHCFELPPYVRLIQKHDRRIGRILSENQSF